MQNKTNLYKKLSIVVYYNAILKAAVEQKIHNAVKKAFNLFVAQAHILPAQCGHVKIDLKSIIFQF